MQMDLLGAGLVLPISSNSILEEFSARQCCSHRSIMKYRLWGGECSMEWSIGLGETPGEPLGG